MKRISLLLIIILNLQYSPLFSSGKSSEMPGLTEPTEQKTAEKFNFLQKKFPHLVARINEPYKPGEVSDKVTTEDKAKEVTKFCVQRLAAFVNDPGIYQEPYPGKTQKELNAIPIRQEVEFRTLEKIIAKKAFSKFSSSKHSKITIAWKKFCLRPSICTKPSKAKMTIIVPFYF